MVEPGFGLGLGEGGETRGVGGDPRVQEFDEVMRCRALDRPEGSDDRGRASEQQRRRDSARVAGCVDAAEGGLTGAERHQIEPSQVQAQQFIGTLPSVLTWLWREVQTLERRRSDVVPPVSGS